MRKNILKQTCDQALKDLGAKKSQVNTRSCISYMSQKSVSMSRKGYKNGDLRYERQELRMNIEWGIENQDAQGN